MIQVSNCSTENFSKILLGSKSLFRVILKYCVAKARIEYRIIRFFLGAPSAITKFQDKVDRIVKKHIALDKPALYCKKGCSACCHIPVTITEDEASTIVQHMRIENLEIDAEAAKAQARSFHGINLSFNERACIFLNKGTGTCRIYSVRPLICRIHYSLTPPSNCVWIGYKDNELKKAQYVVPLAEAKVTAVWRSSKIGSLPQMILSKLNAVHSK